MINFYPDYTKLMRYFFICLLILSSLTACNEEEPPCREVVVPEPFRFIIVDETGANLLSNGITPGNPGIFYLDRGGKVFLELFSEGTGMNTYGVSPVLTLLSTGGVAETFQIERGETIDTLFVQLAREEPGNNCTNFIFSAVRFNNVPATVDTVSGIPVFVLSE